METGAKVFTPTDRDKISGPAIPVRIVETVAAEDNIGAVPVYFVDADPDYPRIKGPATKVIRITTTETGLRGPAMPVYTVS